MNNIKEESVKDRHKTMNQRCFQRNIPSRSLQPYLNVRPVMTKYATFPVIDRRKEATVSINQEPIYSPNAVFNPGTDVAPWSGFATNVSIESELRNQINRLSCSDKTVYVPSSRSDLYSYEWNKQIIADNTNKQPYLKNNVSANIISQNNLKKDKDTDYLGEHVFYNSSRL